MLVGTRDVLVPISERKDVFDGVEPAAELVLRKVLVRAEGGLCGHRGAHYSAVASGLESALTCGGTAAQACKLRTSTGSAGCARCRCLSAAVHNSPAAATHPTRVSRAVFLTRATKVQSRRLVFCMLSDRSTARCGLSPHKQARGTTIASRCVVLTQAVSACAEESAYVAKGEAAGGDHHRWSIPTHKAAYAVVPRRADFRPLGSNVGRREAERRRQRHAVGRRGRPSRERPDTATAAWHRGRRQAAHRRQLQVASATVYRQRRPSALPLARSRQRPVIRLLRATVQRRLGAKQRRNHHRHLPLPRRHAAGDGSGRRHRRSARQHDRHHQGAPS